MGLGKTLQSICILAGDHFHRKQKYAATQNPEFAPVPSLVICPPTLTGHWYHEILNFCDNLKPLLYTGGPAERKRYVKIFTKVHYFLYSTCRLRASLMNYDVIILSYDIIRNDIEELQTLNWNYCILDEGHIIKNGKTKITKAIKSLKSNHRLILSGTPIQVCIILCNSNIRILRRIFFIE